MPALGVVLRALVADDGGRDPGCHPGSERKSVIADGAALFAS